MTVKRESTSSLHLDALKAGTLAASPSPQAVNLPTSFSLNLSGDVNLGGFVFKEGLAFLHNSGGYDAANIALGLGALIDVTPGVPNVASGIINSAFGQHALASNTVGSGNTAIGGVALRSNTTGNNNTAVGVGTLIRNTTGHYNIATGGGALRYNMTGNSNTATGRASLFYNTEGNYNTAVGDSALFANTTGTRNTAVGVDALISNTTGFNNTAVGITAGANWTDGNNNIAIGRGSTGVAGEGGTIRIGGLGLQTKTFIEGIGNANNVSSTHVCVNTATDQLGTCSTTSSARFKQDVRDLQGTSERLLQLRPVSFRYRPEVAGEEGPIQRYGLLAEQVAESFPELTIYDEDGEPYGVRYEMLTPLLLQEVQRQHREIADLERRLDRLAKKKRFRR